LLTKPSNEAYSSAVFSQNVPRLLKASSNAFVAEVRALADVGPDRVLQAFKTACTRISVRQTRPLVADRGRNSCYPSPPPRDRFARRVRVLQAVAQCSVLEPWSQWVESPEGSSSPPLRIGHGPDPWRRPWVQGSHASQGNGRAALTRGPEATRTKHPKAWTWEANGERRRRVIFLELRWIENKAKPFFIAHRTRCDWETTSDSMAVVGINLLSPCHARPYATCIRVVR
jgi:hypothetical protein